MTQENKNKIKEHINNTWFDSEIINLASIIKE